MSKRIEDGTVDAGYKDLYLIGGIAALIAGLVFRRNLGVAEIGVITGHTPPDTVIGWFSLLQGDRLLGIALLNVLDFIDYALLGLMFLALYAALKHVNKSYALLAAAMGLAGIVVYFASNTAWSLVSLSDQYAAATTDAQRSMLLAAGQAIMSTSAPGTLFPSTGMYVSFLLLAAAGFAFSVLMLRSGAFSRATAYAGILASLCDLACCVTFAFVPASAVVLVATAGLLLMISHILIGLRLIRLGRSVLPAETGFTGRGIAPHIGGEI